MARKYNYKCLFVLLIPLLLIACAAPKKNIIYPIVSNYVGSSDFIKYKKIAILPFVDAPGASQSGQIVQGVANQVFAKSGFEVAERSRLFDILSEQKLSLSGSLDPAQSINVGKIMGVKAIVVGEVGQYSVLQRHTDTQTTYMNMPIGRSSISVPITEQGQQWLENHVSIALRIIDVENGQLLYSGTGQYEKGLTNPHQQLAEYILTEIVGKWVASPGLIGMHYEKAPNGFFVVKSVMENSPAEKAGLRAGDVIKKINGKSIQNISGLDFFSILYKKPGDEVVLEVNRNGKIIVITAIAVPREALIKK